MTNSHQSWEEFRLFTGYGICRRWQKWHLFRCILQGEETGKQNESSDVDTKSTVQHCPGRAISIFLVSDSPSVVLCVWKNECCWCFLSCRWGLDYNNSNVDAEIFVWQTHTHKDVHASTRQHKTIYCTLIERSQLVVKKKTQYARYQNNNLQQQQPK